ncbi:MAG: hypothetical protein HY903_03755 [Deltaproteobacteria bacterium]|nr:hypothetical protein [Deltaproteobacteria bacterium]
MTGTVGLFLSVLLLAPVALAAGAEKNTKNAGATAAVAEEKGTSGTPKAKRSDPKGAAVAQPGVAPDPAPASQPAGAVGVEAGPMGGLLKGPLSLGASLGGAFPTNDGMFNCWRLRADGSLPVAQLSPALKLAGMASLGVLLGGNSATTEETIRSTVYTIKREASVTSFDLVPGARLAYEIIPSLYANFDLGLGFGLLLWKSRLTSDSPTDPSRSDSDLDSAAIVRVAGGAHYALGNFVIAAEIVGANFYLASEMDTVFTLTLGASYVVNLGS